MFSSSPEGPMVFPLPMPMEKEKEMEMKKEKEKKKGEEMDKEKEMEKEKEMGIDRAGGCTDLYLSFCLPTIKGTLERSWNLSISLPMNETKLLNSMRYVL